MELVRPVLDGEGQLAAGAPPVLRRVVGHQQSDFANGIHAGRDVSGVQVPRILAGGAIQVEDNLAHLTAIDPRDAPSRPAAEVIPGESLHARQRDDEIQRIPAPGGDVHDLALSDVHGSVGGVGRHKHARSFDRDRGGDVADLEFDLVQVHPFQHGDGDGLLVVSFEAWLGNVETVGAWHQADEDERSARVRRELAHLLGEVVCQLDRGADHNGASRIGNASRELASDALGIGCWQHD